MPSMRSTAQGVIAAMILSTLVLIACSAGSGSTSSVAPTATPQATSGLGFTPGTKAKPRVVAKSGSARPRRPSRGAARGATAKRR